MFAVSANAAQPSIISQPQNLTVNYASDAAFTVVASNAVSYQWYFAGTNLSGTNSVAGGTNATLSLENVNSNNAGSYTVVAGSSDHLYVTSSPPAVLTLTNGTMVQFAISGYAGGGSSNLTIQLFDHDKPATVQNFIHYIEAGAYTNLFWSRCVPGFVLQGGDYDAEDRTNSTLRPGLIYESYTVNLNYSPPFPFEIDNEFNVGPVVHNTYGTIAMAKQSGDPDSANDAFFINLADNSTNLDNQNGGFSVFGRVVSGSNVLEYFNGLSQPTNGIYDSGASPFTDLPVNYVGSLVPADSNLFFIVFQFLTQPTIETTSPTVGITYPANGATTTNADVMVQGTANDEVGLAHVLCNFVYNNQSVFGGIAAGTTNWSYDAGNLPPGSYIGSFESQNGAGYLSPNLGTTFTVPRFPFSVIVKGPGTLSSNWLGTNTTVGSNYTMTATADAGATFVNFTIGTNVYFIPNLSFTMVNGLQMTANFITNAASNIITLTSPGNNAQLTNETFNLSGTISGVPPVQVTCQVFASGTLTAVAPAVTVTNTSSFSVGVTNLAPGTYIAQALAQDAQSNATVITNFFTVMADLTIITNAEGRLTTNAPLYVLPGQLYTVTANAPGAGEQFYSWTSNGVTLLEPEQGITVTGDLTLTVTYLSTNLTAGLAITNLVGATVPAIQSVLTLSGTISSTNVTHLTYQFFVNSNAVTAVQPATIVGANWLLTQSGLTNGVYTVAAVATDTAGESSFISTNFTLVNVEQFNLNIVGNGSVANYPGQSLPGYAGEYAAPGTYVLTAVPGAGDVFYSWSDGYVASLNPTNIITISRNATVTAMFVAQATSLKGVTFVYPPANAKVPSNTFDRVEIKAPASLGVTNVTCQFFLQSNGVTASPQPLSYDSTKKQWTLPVANLTPGPYKIYAVAYDNKGENRLVSENINVLGKLGIEIEPPGKGAVGGGLNGKYLEVGSTNKISATPKAGQVFAYWTGGEVANAYSAATTFVMTNNTVLTAHFTANLFPEVNGTYTGLFVDPTNVTPTNAGFVTVATTGAGVLSGKLMFPPRTYPFGGKFFYDGFAGFQWKEPDSSYLDMFLNLDLTNGTDSITGFVADVTASGTIVWSNSLVLYRAVTRLAGSTAPAAGRYVVLLQPGNITNGPETDGYAAITLGSGGALALGGTLPDNTAISESARMSKDGIWPVYIVPSIYKVKGVGEGMILGWQTNTPSGACEGELYWFKPAIGSATNLASTGAKFQAPAAGTTSQMVVAGVTTNSLPVNNGQHFVADPPIVGITLLPSGVLSGHIDIDGDKLPFKGAYISPLEGGAGFIIGADGQPEGFQILPQP